eukprot:61648_1
MSVSSNTDGIKFMQFSITVNIAPTVDFDCMRHQTIMPGDTLFMNFNKSGCHLNSVEFETFVLKSDDAAIGIKHDIIIKNGECKQICDLYKICRNCSLGIIPVIYTSSIKSFSLSIVAKTEKVTFIQQNIAVNIAPSVTFYCMMDQTIMPGNGLFMNFSISGCHLDSIEFETFLLKSDMDEIGINHDIKFENGVCKQICDPYGNCNPCSSDIVPIVSTKSNDKTFTMSIIAKTWNVTFTQSNITVNIDECSIGSGYDSDAILLDCNECPINSFKMTRGNKPCVECAEQNGFSCDGAHNITINYNLWLAVYQKETEHFVSPLNIASNDTISIHAVKCAPKFCCQLQSGCSYLDSFNIRDAEYIHHAEFGEICAQYRDYTVRLCSRCVHGYYEIFGTTGCGKCDNFWSLLWLIPMTFAGAGLVAFFLFDSKPIDVSIYSAKEVDYKPIIKKDEITVMTIMIFKVLMYYYQQLAQIIASQNITNSLLPLVSFFSLSLDYTSSSNSNVG